MAAPAKKAAPRKAAKKAAPQVSSPAPAGEDTSALYAKLYPQGTELWWYTSRDGTKIPMPRYTTIPAPTRQFWRRLYGLDEMFQAFEWMRWAGVPEPVQALTDHLDDDEYQAMFEGWFAGADLTPGE